MGAAHSDTTRATAPSGAPLSVMRAVVARNFATGASHKTFGATAGPSGTPRKRPYAATAAAAQDESASSVAEHLRPNLGGESRPQGHRDALRPIHPQRGRAPQQSHTPGHLLQRGRSGRARLALAAAW